MSHLSIGIVGGSIAGCSAAIELGRAGHAVTVFERSSGALVGRGAGIGTPTSLFDQLVERDLVDADMPRFEAARHPLVSRSDEDPVHGHVALVLDLHMALCNWGDLYRNLRRRVPDPVYRGGTGVAAVEFPNSDCVRLRLEDGSLGEFDLVVFGDGYQSLGRRTLFPTISTVYRGYVLWRGVLEERDLPYSDPLETSLYRMHYKGLPGNAVFYFVPGADGSTEKGRRWVNWACYVPVDEHDLPYFLTDRHGHSHASSLPPGSMRVEEEQRLKHLMAKHLPSYYADIVAASRDTFAQPIFTVEVPAYFEDRCCLVGDAGSVAPPFTGSGVFKAANNAVDLAKAVGAGSDTIKELRAWSDQQVVTANRISLLGHQMERAFVWDAPDFAEMGKHATRSWWKSAITFPDDFSYVDSDD